jgi:hypothetical protein
MTDRQKQKQRQSLKVIVNVAAARLRKRTKRVRAPARADFSALQASFQQQPVTRFIRYDVPAAVPYAEQLRAANINLPTPTPPRVIAEETAPTIKEEPVVKLNKDGTPAKPKGRPKGSKNRPLVRATLVNRAADEAASAYEPRGRFDATFREKINKLTDDA